MTPLLFRVDPRDDGAAPGFGAWREERRLGRLFGADRQSPQAGLDRFRRWRGAGGWLRGRGALLDTIRALASGRETAAERNDERGIAIWKRGVTL
jgi:hypothetical protein